MGARFELVIDGDTARLPLRLELRTLDPDVPRVGVVTAPIDATPDWEARARPWTSGPFHWFWPHGTRLQLVEQRDGMLRARLTETLSAWLPAADVRLLPPGTPAPFSTIGGVRFVHHADAIDVHIPMREPLPFRVDEDGNVLTIDVYGAKSTSNFFQYGRLDPLIERAEWSQPDDDIYRVTLRLRQPVWGYATYRAANGDLVVRVRRPPVIDAEQPLRGLRIALDAGHPPGGAIGPTRLTEADANLAIARALRPLLESAGAHVIMIRQDEAAVDLGARPRMATDSSAHVLLSIHNNAFPDGVDPFENNGTSAYYFHPHSADLAQHLQRELLAELQLRDIGIGRADLALVRPTWMPAVLTETMFLMLPRQEAALRDPDVHERIARAHLRGLETFLRARAAAQD
jgi:N-acetylmuramoyl-L-alanine amidase